MFEWIDVPFDWLGSLLGVPSDMIKIPFCLLSSYPLSGTLKRLPQSPFLRNTFCILVGLFYLIPVHHLTGGTYILLFDALFTYFTATLVRTSYMPWMVFVVILSHTFYSHVCRYFYPSGGSDITASQMVLCMKLTAFAWSVHDGRQPENVLSDYQKQRRLTKMPSPFFFLGYVFFFPSLLVGPAFDYVDYEHFITLSMFDRPQDPLEQQITPHSLRPALGRCWRGALWLLGFLFGTSLFPLSFLLSPQFASFSLLKKYGYVILTAFIARMKYYGAWELSDGACILSGIGYNGVDELKRPRWDRVKNIDPIGFEFASNIKGALEAWNKNTNKWLRNYVYLRVAKKGKRPGFKSTLSTFTVSALWHGVSPGYYTTFVSAAFVQTIAKYHRRYIRPFFLQQDMKTPNSFKKVYDFVGVVATNITVSYLIISFLLLTLSDSIYVWSKLRFLIHIYIVLSMVVFHSPVKAKLNKEIKKRTEKADFDKYDAKTNFSDTDIVNMSIPDAESFAHSTFTTK
ncbi:membrane bound O-acyltransferase [Schizosaccharomyces cryophilus OY26]|uniref:Membrane bound O-acyltransferase n=1 Tax=Schizosaccharomyces cryophilus (strain OY26 / ATCC MYA-4695 / CBS 11777 / NBRC 106824 / NRRL Y48691) TaxID=653667 RepID=S9VQP8_SCHCR|nr:membrane bound O-acyltransferase [Schizosaccharomyces cryophilus OY26]EPY50263.1 membrane bound O-acyltransferase [Schizosaccharomyces cryophilus OY26]